MPPGLKRSVLQRVQFGTREARITKEELGRYSCGKYNATIDRYIRETVEELRTEGFPIVSDSGHAGYYFASSLDEIETLTAELESRSKKMLEQSRMMKRRAIELFGAQQALF